MYVKHLMDQAKEIRRSRIRGIGIGSGSDRPEHYSSIKSNYNIEYDIKMKKYLRYRINFEILHKKNQRLMSHNAKMSPLIHYNIKHEFHRKGTWQVYFM